MKMIIYITILIKFYILKMKIMNITNNGYKISLIHLYIHIIMNIMFIIWKDNFIYKVIIYIIKILITKGIMNKLIILILKFINIIYI